MKTKILFVVESVTLAQVVRLAYLAERLPKDQFDVHFASDKFPEESWVTLPGTRHFIPSLPRELIDSRLKKGNRLYEYPELAEYVKDDLDLIGKVKPDIIVGDFRLSLSTSARLMAIPLITLINAYWHKNALRKFPVPDHPIVSMVGEETAEKFFPIARAKVFSHFSQPFIDLKKRHGLIPVQDLQDILSEGDVTLFADIPSLVPLKNLPANQAFLGGLLWSPESEEKQYFKGDRKVKIYLCLGSSGNEAMVQKSLDACAKLNAEVLLSTAGRTLKNIQPGVNYHSFVDGKQACEQADLVICNGGSSTGYQAIAAGTPVLAIPSNLDQYLATQVMVEAKAALRVRAASADSKKIFEAAKQLINSQDFNANAARLADEFKQFDPSKRFQSVVERIISSKLRSAS